MTPVNKFRTTNNRRRNVLWPLNYFLIVSDKVKRCDTFALSHIHSSSMQAGSAAATEESKNSKKYADVTAGIDFVPVVIETSGI
jgi:hypothetical protein